MPVVKGNDESSVKEGGPPAEEKGLSAPRFTIAVLDDLPVTGQLIALILRTNMDCRVQVFQTAEDLLNQPPEKTPDLYLLDIMLDNGSGIDVCRHLREDPHRRRIPVVFLSAHGKPEVRVAALKAGGNDYLDKPFYPEELLVRVRAQLALHAADLHCEEERQRAENELASWREMLMPLLRDILGFLPLAEQADASLRQASAGLAQRCRQLFRECENEKPPERLQGQWNPSRFSLANLLQQAAVRVEPECNEKGVSIDIDCPEAGTCFFDAELLRDGLVVHLLRDAIRFSFPQRTVKVRAASVERAGVVGWQIAIRDGSDEDRDMKLVHQIMARFPQSRKFSSPPIPGSQEWFTVMQLRLLEHGAEMQIDSAPGQGRTVTTRIWDQ